MKWILNIFNAGFKIYISRAETWIFLIFAIGIALLPLYNIQSSSTNDKIKIAFVNEDTGNISTKFLESFSQNDLYQTIITDKQTALSKLQKGDIEAVFILKDNFTTQLSIGKFNSIIEPIYSPASNAKATISEPIINSALMYWIEEFVVQRTKEYLEEEGIQYTTKDELEQRQNIKTLWEQSMSLEIRSNLEESTSAEDEIILPQIALSAKWYAALCIFFILLSSIYYIDILKKGISSRLMLAGAKVWQIMLGIILPVILISMAGWFVIVLIFKLFLGFEFLQFLSISISLLVYLITISALSIIFVSLTKNIITILLLAPIVTFVNAVLGELIVSMPQWALFLRKIAFFLPGKWMSMSVNSIFLQSSMHIGLFICCGVYISIALIFIQFQDKNKII